MSATTTASLPASRPMPIRSRRGPASAALAFALAGALVGTPATSAAASAGSTAGAIATAPAAPLQLVFESARDGDTEIYRTTRRGTVVQLTDNTTDDFGAVWSPDGRRLAFVSSRDGDPEVFTMSATGRLVRQLTHNDRSPGGGPAVDSAPAWSPDGQHLAFASTRDGGEAEIYVMRADGSEQRRITTTEPFVLDHEPAWSPDGTRIAFASNRVGFENVELFSARPDGTDVQRLTTTIEGVDDNAPAWSPDGRTLAFSSNRAGQHDVHVMPAGGGPARRVTGSPTLDEVFPRWTSDGQRLVFSTFRGADGQPAAVWAVDLDGSDRVQLTSAAEPGAFGVPRPVRTR